MMNVLRRCMMATACILATMVMSAQRVNVNWGPIVKADKRVDVERIVGKDKDGGYYVLVKTVASKPRFFLERYSKDNKKMFSKEILMPDTDGKDVNFESMLMVDGQLLLFTSFYNKKVDKNYAFVSKVTKDGDVERSIKEIDMIQADRKKNSGTFDFLLSADSSRVLVYHNEPYEKYAQESFSIKVMDKALNVQWNKMIKLPYKDKDFTVSNYTISNDDKVYMLAKIQEGNREKKKGKPNYKYTILSYDKTDAKANEYLISLDEKYVSDITFQIGPDNNLICAGFYSKNNSYSTAGTFFMRIDSKSGNVISKNVKEFDKAALEQFMSSKKAEKERELYNYDIRKLIPKEDGGSVMVAEQFYIREVTTTDSKTGATHTTYYYYYNDVLVVDINKDGNIGWVTRIPKKQVSANDGGYYSSFAISVVKDKVFLVYNDNPKNLLVTDPKDIKKVSNLKKSQAILATINPDGSYTKTALFNAKEKDIFLRPKMHLQTDKKTLVLHAIKKKDVMFGTLSVE